MDRSYVKSVEELVKSTHDVTLNLLKDILEPYGEEGVKLVKSPCAPVYQQIKNGEFFIAEKIRYTKESGVKIYADGIWSYPRPTNYYWLIYESKEGVWAENKSRKKK